MDHGLVSRGIQIFLSAIMARFGENVSAFAHPHTDSGVA
jgi:hypothetical protein